MGKTATRGFGLDEVSIVPSRRARAAEEVDLSWSLDAFRFDAPVLAAPSDGVTSPTTATTLGGLGVVAPLNLEGVWTRHRDASAPLAEIATLNGAEHGDRVMDILRGVHEAPVDMDLITDRVKEMREHQSVVAVSVTPRRVAELLPAILKAEPDLLVVSGPVVSAEVLAEGEPLNLKSVLRRLEIPVLVGGCTSYHTALHLMRTGAAGVLVGVGSGHRAGVADVLGIAAAQATAIADARAARMRHMDETGVYCQVIANGGVRTSGDMARAIACGADAVMLGSPLAGATDSPAGGWMWSPSALHPTLPRSRPTYRTPRYSLEQTLCGPATWADGRANLLGGLRKAVALSGYANVKQFQKAELVVSAPTRVHP